MTTTEKSDIAERAKAIYEARIRSLVEADHHGEFVAVDVDSGDYEMDKDMLEATHRLRTRRPQTRTFVLRVGYRAAFESLGMSIRKS